MATMNTSQMISYTLEYFLADGTTPAQVQAGSVVAASSDETVVRVSPDAADENKGSILAVAEGGPARVTFTADADMGSGVVTLTGVTEDITVTQDPATLASTFRITLGAPVAKAPAAPASGSPATPPVAAPADPNAPASPPATLPVTDPNPPTTPPADPVNPATPAAP